MKSLLNRRKTIFFGASCALSLALAAQAQTFPSKPMRIIVPFTPGGSSDVLARAIGLELGKALNQPVVIENVPGAGARLALKRRLGPLQMATRC